MFSKQDDSLPADGTPHRPPLSVAEAPLYVDTPADIDWTREVDIVVVGFGAAGACAALQAHEEGADVVVLDRFNGGGATAYSGGIVYAGATRVQAREGVDDDIEDMYRYLKVELRDAVEPETLRRFCEGSAADVDWLIDHGMPLTGTVFKEKTFYPPEKYSLYYSGNEKQLAQKIGARPAPRGHRALGKGYTGNVFFGTLRDAVERRKIDVVRHAPVTRLIVDRAGRVIGVEAQAVAEADTASHQAIFDSVTPLRPLDPEAQERDIEACRKMECEQKVELVRIRARRGVVLATGGFVFNREKIAEVRPFVAAHLSAIVRLGSIGDDGSGMDLGCSVGGTVSRPDSFFINRSISPPAALLEGVAVNQHGERFLNEDAYTGDLGAAIAKQPGGKAWLILDRYSFLRALWQCVTAPRAEFKLLYAPTLLNIVAGGTRWGVSIRGLARKLGIEPDRLALTLAEYNRTSGIHRDPFGKLVDHLRPISDAPYFALNLAVTNRFSFSKMFTLGGLRVDEKTGAVLTEGGEAIAGLYAAGRVAVGLCSGGYISGMSLADCVFSGRRAGRAASMERSAADLEAR